MAINRYSVKKYGLYDRIEESIYKCSFGERKYELAFIYAAYRVADRFGLRTPTLAPRVPEMDQYFKEVTQQKLEAELCRENCMKVKLRDSPWLSYQGKYPLLSFQNVGSPQFISFPELRSQYINLEHIGNLEELPYWMAMSMIWSVSSPSLLAWMVDESPCVVFWDFRPIQSAEISSPNFKEFIGLDFAFKLLREEQVRNGLTAFLDRLPSAFEESIAEGSKVWEAGNSLDWHLARANDKVLHQGIIEEVASWFRY